LDNVSEFTIDSPKGATHAVTIIAENWSELEQMREAWLTNTKSVQKLRHYNKRTKAGTTKE
jgi:hypothetical protein